MEASITVDFKPNASGKTRGVLCIRNGDEVIHSDTLDIAKDRPRTTFLQKVCEKFPGIDGNDLCKTILECVDQQLTPTTASPLPSAEIEAGLVVRPHLFHLPQVSGVLVPVTKLNGDGKPSGEWVQHLQWADGKRKTTPLCDRISLPDGRTLWFAPLPGLPAAGALCQWSQAGRKKWLEGYSPNPAEVLGRLLDEFGHYLNFREDEQIAILTTLSLWTMLTYVFPVWPAVPYLYVGGPMGSGKSRLFDVLNELVFRPLSSCNVTSACLFRTLHTQGGTLLLDEAEHLTNHTPEAGELLRILLAGYKSGQTAIRLEKVGDAFESVSFQVYGPKAIAAIHNLHPTLASRCVRIAMFRAAKGSPVSKRRITNHAEAFVALRDDLYAFGLTFGKRLMEASSAKIDYGTLSGRDYEVWSPIIGIALLVQDCGLDGIVDLVTEYATKSIDVTNEDSVSDVEEMLLKVAKEMCEGNDASTPAKILSQAQARDSVAFAHYSARGVSNVLKRYGLRTTKSNGERVYRPSTGQFKEIQDVYGFDLGLSNGEHSDDHTQGR